LTFEICKFATVNQISMATYNFCSDDLNIQ